MPPRHRERSIRHLSDYEVGWVAGLIEGEGSFIVRMDPRRGVPRPRVSIFMTDLDIIERLMTAVGGGVITKVRKLENRKQSWSWILSSRDDVLYLCDQLYPHMGSRRQGQIDALRSAVLTHMETV